MSARRDIGFPSGDGRCGGWLYAPSGSAGDAPCVVMAHGFATCKEARLDAYAERFAAAGLAVLVFDYRHFGASSGEPRQLVHIRRQHQDWEGAVAYARGLAGVDAKRIALWGTSFSGGHVVHIAARDRGIAAVVSQAPHLSGIATVARIEPSRGLRLTAAALRDRLGALRGRPPRYVPIVGPPGSLATMTSDGAERAYHALHPPGFEPRNEVAPRAALGLLAYSPGREARRVRCPLLVIAGERDAITPPGPARRAAARAPRGELLTYDGAHFDIYSGAVFEWAVEAELEFLRRALLGEAEAVSR